MIFLILFETTLRIFNISSGYDYPKGMFQKDSLLGYSMTPNFEGVLIKPEFKTEIHTNSQGLRDKEYDQKEDDEFRILAIGDSCTWGGYGTDLEETYLKLLEKKLNERGSKSFSVINAGVPGYNTLQEYLYLKERGINYEPNMILLTVALNDFMDNSLNLEDIVIKDGVKITNKAKTGILFEVRSFLLINFQSYRLFERGVTISLGDFIQRWINKDIKDDKRLETLFSKNISFEPNKDFELTFEILDDINDFLKNKNILFVITVMPLKYQVDENLKQGFVEINGFDLNNLNFDKPQAMIKNWAGKNDVMFIDLLPDLRIKNKNNDFYWKLNPHFNKEGNEEVANIIFNRFIREEAVMGDTF